MTTTIGLIRHGVTEWNYRGIAQGVSDIPLHEDGKLQASKMGERLSQEEKWDVIISSDLVRASETGEIIGSKINLTISYKDQRLREVNYGQIEGTTEDDRIEKWGQGWDSIDVGIETDENVAKRGIEILEEVVKNYEGKRVLIVSHGAFIRITLKSLLPDLDVGTSMENTAMTVITHDEGKWNCLLYNCHKHLLESVRKE